MECLLVRWHLQSLEVIEQITYLLFIRRLDDLHTLEENKSIRLKKPMERHIFPKGKDAKGRDYNDLRWSRFKNLAPTEMFSVISEHVFPFLRSMGGDGSTYAQHMKDARFTIPTQPSCPRWWTRLTSSRWKVETPRAIYTNTCCARLQALGRTGNFAGRVIAVPLNKIVVTGATICRIPAVTEMGYSHAQFAGDIARKGSYPPI